MSKQGGWPPTGFGTRLRELREGQGLTQQQLAERIGVHAMTVYNLEKGSHEPAWPLVLILARVLGAELPDFLPGGRIPNLEQLRPQSGKAEDVEPPRAKSKPAGKGRGKKGGG
jgi:transcriptional regulator with XRE-family HTH domain